MRDASSSRPTGRRRAVLIAAALAVTAAALGSASATTAGAQSRRGASTEARVQATTQAAPALPIGHSGRWLTDGAGRVVLFHGVNVVAKGPDETPASMGFGADDVQWLVDNGFDVVRLGTTVSALMPKPGVINQAAIDSFAATAKQITDAGMLVLVDLHQDGWGPEAQVVGEDGTTLLGNDGFPAWMTLTGDAPNKNSARFPMYYLNNPAIQTAFESFWHDAQANGKGLQEWTGQALGALAQAVGSNDGIVGYDLLNEPWPGTNYLPCVTGENGPNTGCPSQDAASLDPYYARATAAIRQHDPQHMVFGEPWVLFNFGNGLLGNDAAVSSIKLPGGDPESGMAYHMYTDARPLNTIADAIAAEPAVQQGALAWAQRTGGAVINTEFGTPLGDTQAQQVESTNRMIDELDGVFMPWIWWAFTDGEFMIHDLNKPPTAPGNLFDPFVDQIVRPHALAVAGTPTKTSYDNTAHTFDFSYSTTGPGGKTYPAGTVSSFQVAARTYPDGYNVTVSGAKVTSEPNARLLTLEACPGATSVSVTVKAGSGAPSESCPEATTSSTTTPGTAAPATTAPATPPPAGVIPAASPAVGVLRTPRYTG